MFGILPSVTIPDKPMELYTSCVSLHHTLPIIETMNQWKISTLIRSLLQSRGLDLCEKKDAKTATTSVAVMVKDGWFISMPAMETIFKTGIKGMRLKENLAQNLQLNNKLQTSLSGKWDKIQTHKKSRSVPFFDAANIGETVYETLGQPEGADAAAQYFGDGIDAALRAIAQAEAKNESTFTYLYAAHPDKNMHALGTNHEQVEAVVRGIDHELERMWNILGNREELLSNYGFSNNATTSRQASANQHSTGDTDRVDAVLVVSADHGHVTVQPEEMVVLPQSIVDCLEYANVGVFGPGRHAYLHVRAGLQSRVQDLWHATKELKESFILLTIEHAAEEVGLFGPEPLLKEVRPRLGDFVAISVNNHTLVSPREADGYQCCRGVHGSLLPEEMNIPFVTCVPP